MQEPSGSPADTAARNGSTAEVFAAFLRLGLTSFGGPIAHLGYFHEEFVVRRKWLDEKTYVDLVALSQFLPGPASSKVGIALGLSRAGYAGAFAAWTGSSLQDICSSSEKASVTMRQLSIEPVGQGEMQSRQKLHLLASTT